MEYYKKGDVTWGVPVASSCNVLVGQEEPAQPGKPEIQISPNPLETVTRIFIKDYFNAGRLRYIIYDFLGNQIKKEEFLPNPFLFDRSGLSGGLYFMKVFDDDGLIGIKKILVR